MKNIVFAVILVALGIGGYFAYRHFSQTPEAVQTALPETLIEETTSEGPDPVEETMPYTQGPDSSVTPDSEPLEEPIAADRYLRDSLNDLKDDSPVLEEILIRDDLIRKTVTAVDLAGRGKNPRGQFDFLDLKTEFQVVQREGRSYLSDENYSRYEPYLGALEKLNIGWLGSAYRRLEPLCNRLYDELGNQDHNWDERVQQAIDQILAMEVPEGEIELSGKQGVYIFADDRLERLPSVHKALIRMGPENARRLQNKLREIRQALAFE